MKKLIFLFLILAYNTSFSQCFLKSEITYKNGFLSVPDTFGYYEWYQIWDSVIKKTSPLLSNKNYLELKDAKVGDFFIVVHWKTERCILSNTVFKIPPDTVKPKQKKQDLIIYPNPTSDSIKANYETFIICYDINMIKVRESKNNNLSLYGLVPQNYIIITNKQRKIISKL